MFHRKILQYLTDAINSLDDSLLPVPKTIVLPNEFIPDEASSLSVFFEIFSGGIAPEYDTETSTRGSLVGSIVINGKINAGISLVDAIAEALVYCFSPVNPRRFAGFKTSDFRDDHPVDVYVSGVERSETGTDGGRFKCTIFVTFDIYEGE